MVETMGPSSVDWKVEMRAAMMAVVKAVQLVARMAAESVAQMAAELVGVSVERMVGKLVELLVDQWGVYLVVVLVECLVDSKVE